MSSTLSLADTPSDKGGDGRRLSAVIAAFLRAAEAGRARDGHGAPYTRAGLRDLRSALTHVDADLGSADVDVVEASHLQALVERLHDAGLPPSRISAIVEAMRSLYAYASENGLAAGDPAADAITSRDRDENRSQPFQAPPATHTMLALGTQVSAWAERIIVMAFVLTAIALVLELT